MKYCFPLCVAVMLVFCGMQTFADSPDRNASQDMRNGGNPDIVPNLLIIKFRENTSFTSGGDRLGIGSLDHILDRIGAKAVEPFNTRKETSLQKSSHPALNIDRMVKIRYTTSDRPELLAQEISSDPAVEYAEPYYIFHPTLTPNDPQLSNQWALSIMKLPEAWDITTGDSTIIIGDVDTGVDWTHEDLAQNIWINPGEWGTNGELKDNGIDDDGNGMVDDWHGWDFVGAGSYSNLQPDNNPMDNVIGHGTNTSGCAAARTDNGIGVAGTSFRAKILAVKTASDNQRGILTGYEGIIYAAQMGAKIINCSWGGTGVSSALQDVINDATNLGSLIVTSAGNDGVDNDYVPYNPVSLDHVLSVGSIESNGQPSGWANYGNSVHVYAPGNGIRTTRKGGGYTSPTGTSFSSPLTAGVAALVFSVHPDWTPDQVAAQLRVTADYFDDPPTSKHYGRVNAYKAVTLNDNLDDIPGIRVVDFQFSIDGGNFRFTEPGQSAHVTMILENVLAPTSAEAFARVDLDDPSVSSNATDFSLAGMNTFDTKTIEFDVKLSEAPEISEGNIPIRVRIGDGEYTDFLMGRIPIYLADAWHASLNFGNPWIVSIDAATFTSIWAAANVGSNDMMLRTVNGGGSWSLVQSGGTYPDGQGVFCVEARTSSTALVGTGPDNGSAGVYRTVNGGTSWTSTSVSEITGFVNWIHMFDDQNGILQGDPKDGVWGIATTTDGGITWTPIATDVTAPTGEAGWNNAYAAVGDSLWFGTNNSKIYRSTDRGETWTSISTPGKHSATMAFADSKRGIIRFTAMQNQGGEEMLAVTEDGGDTWTEVTSLEVTADGGSVEMEPYGRRIWYAQGSNVFVSDDMGATWTVQATPGNFNYIRCSSIFTNSSLIDIYTAGLNVFKYRTNFEPYETTPVTGPASADVFHLDALYPNPLSSSSANGLTIGFTLDTRSETRVDLYDQLGRLVRHGMSAELHAGRHTVNLQTAGLAAGNYLVRVQAGSRIATGSLVVMY